MAVLPESELTYLFEKGITYEEVSDGNQHALILRGYPLPPKYDQRSADILIILPTGFPDAPPDMFYLFPWVKLTQDNQYPRAANVALQFAGISWQRWSRHSNDWRAGRDGLPTFIKRIQHAIETATP